METGRSAGSAGPLEDLVTAGRVLSLAGVVVEAIDLVPTDSEQMPDQPSLPNAD